jgi:hypothetical protein
MNLRSKISILLLGACAVAIAAVGYRSVQKVECPGASKLWAYRGYPNATSTESALVAFVEQGPSFGEIEEWSRNKNCSGDGELVGRVFAAAVEAKSQDVLLGYLYIAVVDSKKSGSSEAAATEFLRIFSSPYARRIFDTNTIDASALNIRKGDASFAQTLLEVLSGPLSPQTRQAFEKEVRANRLAKGKP